MRAGHLFLLTVLMVSGCSSAGSLATSGRPLDPHVAQVSLSSITKDGQAALDACGLTDSTGRLEGGRPYGTEQISGMGKIAHAREVGSYALVTGREPELQSDQPAWVIEITGMISDPFAGTLTNPTCVVVESEPYWYVTGSQGDGDNLVTAPPLAPGPSFGLPPLVK